MTDIPTAPSPRLARGRTLPAQPGAEDKPKRPLPFGPFERMVAFRYLRSRRQEGFVSVIAIFSLLGIALGVATLIVVMAVMNGFRVEFVSNIVGINGYLRVYGAGEGLTGFDDLVAKLRQ